MKLRMSIAIVALIGASVVATPALLEGQSGQQADPNFHAAVKPPAFISKHPLICFDEAHHNFHTSVGRYQPFAALAASDGFRVRRSESMFTATALNGCGVLVIANALGTTQFNDDAAFTTAEIDAVRQWVEGGGSLLLIADHFPMGPAASALSRSFGVDMSGGATSDPKNFDTPSGDETQLVFSRTNGLLGDHPITRGRSVAEQVSLVMTFTGQSLSVPPGSTGLLNLSQTAIDEEARPRLEKVGSNVIVKVGYGNAKSAHGRAQAVALTWGKGRLVIAAEAGMLTAQLDGKTKRPFGMNVPGVDNQQFAINVLRWLAGAL